MLASSRRLLSDLCSRCFRVRWCKEEPGLLECMAAVEFPHRCTVVYPVSLLEYRPDKPASMEVAAVTISTQCRANLAMLALEEAVETKDPAMHANSDQVVAQSVARRLRAKKANHHQASSEDYKWALPWVVCRPRLFPVQQAAVAWLGFWAASAECLEEDK